MSQWWQIALVVIIELGALVFLVSRLVPRRPRVLTKPDVKVSSLVRKKKDCH